ncbi:MAG: hypothetical protein AAGD38_01490 [Acidobacteriota bacterium]
MSHSGTRHAEARYSGTSYVIDFDAWRRHRRLVRHPSKSRSSLSRPTPPPARPAPKKIYRPEQPPLETPTHDLLTHGVDVALGISIATAAAIPAWPVASRIWNRGAQWDVTEATLPVLGLFFAFGVGLAGHGAAAWIGRHRERQASEPGPRPVDDRPEGTSTVPSRSDASP